MAITADEFAALTRAGGSATTTLPAPRRPGPVCAQIKAGQGFEVDDELAVRLALLIRIHRQLRNVVPEPARADL